MAAVELAEQAKPYFPEHLSELAVSLFDRLQDLHGLSAAERLILERAALIPAASLQTTEKKRNRAIRELAGAQAGQELDAEQQKVLAAVVMLQHRVAKLKDIKRMDLNRAQRRSALTLAAILRIAEGLDHSGSGETVIQRVEPSTTGIWIIIDGPAAAVDGAEAQKSARLWVKMGYPEVEALEANEAATRQIPLPLAEERSGILPDDTLAEAGRKVMRYQFGQMLRHEEGTRLGVDVEALHDMRVATRRLRAAFEIFGEAFEPDALKPHLKGLKATGRALGSVRDLDVFMEKAQKYLATLPEEKRSGLDPLLREWGEQRNGMREQLLLHMNSWEYASFKQKFNLFLHTPGTGVKPQPAGQITPDRVYQLAAVSIYSRMAAVRAFASLLDDAPVERLHALRIEFKKLRYTVEYFSEVLGKRSLDVINDLKLLQDHLGDLNDAQVATQIIGGFIEGWDAQQQTLAVQERQNIEDVVNYLAKRHAERHQLMVTFRETWEEHFDNHKFRRNLAQAIAVL